MLGLIKKILPDRFVESIKKDYYKMQELSHRGNAVVCPLCASEYAYFMASGNPRRSNAKCLNCEALERHRFIWLELNKRGYFQDNFRLLHIAPELPFYRQFKEMSNCDYRSCDLEPLLFPYAEPDKEDLTKLSYQDSSFDLIICNHVMEHVEDDISAYRQMFRVLDKEGIAIISVPNAKEREKTIEDKSINTPAERNLHYGQPDHVRIYGMDIIDKLSSLGFEVETVDCEQKYSMDERKRYGLMAQEIFFICRKK